MRLVADARAVLEQELHDVHMAALGSARERRHAVLRTASISQKQQYYTIEIERRSYNAIE